MGTDWKVMGKRCLLSLFCLLWSSRLIRPSLLKSKRSLKKDKPRSGIVSLLGLRDRFAESKYRNNPLLDRGRAQVEIISSERTKCLGQNDEQKLRWF